MATAAPDAGTAGTAGAAGVGAGAAGAAAFGGEREISHATAGPAARGVEDVFHDLSWKRDGMPVCGAMCARHSFPGFCAERGRTWDGVVRLRTLLVCGGGPFGDRTRPCRIGGPRAGG